MSSRLIWAGNMLLLEIEIFSESLIYRSPKLIWMKMFVSPL